MNELLWAIIACGAVSIIYAVITIQQVMAADAGNEKMQEIATAIREGAQAYLNRQYITIAMVGGVIFLAAFYLGWQVAFGFAIGAIILNRGALSHGVLDALPVVRDRVFTISGSSLSWLPSMPLPSARAASFPRTTHPFVG